MNLAVPEIARVLVPGGVLAGLWNVDDDREEWVAGLGTVCGNAASLALSAWRTTSQEAYPTQPAELFRPSYADLDGGYFEPSCH